VPPPKALPTETLIHGMMACRTNARELIADAEVLSGSGRHARAYAILYTACEELGKFSILETGARGLFRGKPPEWKRFWRRFRSHDSKSAQLEVQLLMLTISSSNTDDFVTLAETLFSRGLHVRNAALYVDFGPDGSFRKPSDINFDVPHPGLRAVAKYALAATDERGETATEIESFLKVAPNSDTLRTAGLMFARTFERLRDAGFDKEEVHEMLSKRYM
jgi:AbiV family abortive infection protein